MNATRILSLVLACALLATVLPAASAAQIVELRLDDVYAKEPLDVEANLTWGNRTHTTSLHVPAGGEVSVGHAFLDASLTVPQRVTLTTSDGSPVFDAETRFEDGALRLKDADVDLDALDVPREGTSLHVVRGSVTGTFQVQVAFDSPSAAQGATVTLAVDGNGNGSLEPSESTQFTPTGAMVNASVDVANVPSTSPWSLTVDGNGSTLAAWRGVWNWIDGAHDSFNRQQQGDNAEATKRLDEVSWTPRRESITGLYPVPNILLLGSVDGSNPQQGDMNDQGLVVTFDDGSQDASQDAEPANASTSSSEAGIATGWTDAVHPDLRPWLPLLGALVLVLVASLIAIVVLARRGPKKGSGRMVLEEEW